MGANVRSTIIFVPVPSPRKTVAQKGKKKLAYTVTRSSGESIRTDRYRYNRWGNEGEELYDHQADPKEFTNLVGMEQHSDTLERLRALLETKKREVLN